MEPKPITLLQATKQAAEHSEQIMKHWDMLHKILERHESSLQKRWRKRNREKRKKILLAACPNMPSSHRPDFQAFRSELATKRDAYLLPEINLEDLMEPKNLLIFLDARGNNAPHVFQQMDSKTLMFGRGTGAIEMRSLEGYYMYLTGTTPHQYGRLMAKSSPTDTSNLHAERSLDPLDPGVGLIILERQERILTFLIACCKSLLPEMGEAALIGAPIQAKPPPIASESNDWSDVAALALEAPYRAPALLDLEVLKAILSAKRSACEDHIWNLREDPAYFESTAKEYFEHRQENVLDTNGRSHPLMQEAGHTKLWDRVLRSVIFDAYDSLTHWDLLHSDVTAIADLKERISKLKSPDKELVRECTAAAERFDCILSKIMFPIVRHLKEGIPSSPPFRTQYVRAPPLLPAHKVVALADVLGGEIIRIGVKQAFDLQDPQFIRGVGENYLLWLFNVLFDPEHLQYFGPGNAMDELERFFRHNPKELAKLSSWVLNRYTELGIMALARHVLLTSIRKNLPMYESIQHSPDIFKLMHEKDDIQLEYEKDNEPVLRLFTAHKSFALAALGAPIKRRFHYPCEKCPNQENVEAMRKSEQNLDNFWASVDQQYKEFDGLGGRTLQQDFEYLFSDGRQIERTPEWVEPLKIPTQKPSSDITDLPSISNLSISTEDRVSKQTYDPRKEKIKTRGWPGSDPADTQAIPGDNLPEDTDPEPRFVVNQKIAKVFKTLFHTVQTADLPGEIPWIDFLAAMVAVGFSPSKLYGSVWLFTPMNLDMERSIQFHEPHPKTKIQFRMARYIGRRLNRAYGWHGGMFETA